MAQERSSRGAETANLGQSRSSMSLLELEAPFEVGTHCSVLIEVVAYDPTNEGHQLKTALRGTVIRDTGILPHASETTDDKGCETSFVNASEDHDTAKAPDIRSGVPCASEAGSCPYMSHEGFVPHAPHVHTDVTKNQKRCQYLK